MNRPEHSETIDFKRLATPANDELLKPLGGMSFGESMKILEALRGVDLRQVVEMQARGSRLSEENDI